MENLVVECGSCSCDLEIAPEDTDFFSSTGELLFISEDGTVRELWCIECFKRSKDYRGQPIPQTARYILNIVADPDARAACGSCESPTLH